MPGYDEFCESLWVGKARAEETEAEERDERHAFERAVGRVVREMCECFGCPAGAAHYVDPQSHLAALAPGDLPPLCYDPEKGRHALDVEIVLHGGPDEAAYPVWVHLEFVPLRHGEVEAYIGPERFRLPEQQSAFFDHVAEAVNRELRAGYRPGPRLIGA